MGSENKFIEKSSKLSVKSDYSQPLKKLDAWFSVDGLLAEVCFEYSFVNDSNRNSEFEYLLPLPTTAFDLKAEVESAEVESKKSIVFKRIRPNLCIFSGKQIKPQTEFFLQIKFNDLLKREDDNYFWALPTFAAPRFSKKSQTDSKNELNFEPITYSKKSGEIPYEFNVCGKIKNAENVEFARLRGSKVDIFPRDGALEVEFDRDSKREGTKDLFLEIKYKSEALQNLIRRRENSTYFYSEIRLPREIASNSEVFFKEYVTLIDASASCARLSQIIREFVLTEIRSFRTFDKFNLFYFNDGVQSGLYDASEFARSFSESDALDFVESFKFEGITELASALEAVLSKTKPKGFDRNVIVLSDFLVDNEAEVLKIIGSAASEVSFHSVCLGPHPNRFLAECFAKFGGGSLLNLPFPAGGIFDSREFLDKIVSKPRSAKIDPFRDLAVEASCFWRCASKYDNILSFIGKSKLTPDALIEKLKKNARNLAISELSRFDYTDIALDSAFEERKNAMRSLESTTENVPTGYSEIGIGIKKSIPGSARIEATSIDGSHRYANDEKNPEKRDFYEFEEFDYGKVSGAKARKIKRIADSFVNDFGGVSVVNFDVVENDEKLRVKLKASLLDLFVELQKTLNGIDNSESIRLEVDFTDPSNVFVRYHSESCIPDNIRQNIEKVVKEFDFSEIKTEKHTIEIISKAD